MIRYLTHLGHLVEHREIWRPCAGAGDGAGKGNRTLIASLEGWSFTIKLCPRFAEKT